jgi:CubicO group peptidase (beta-lactamase class C family)
MSDAARRGLVAAGLGSLLWPGASSAAKPWTVGSPASQGLAADAVDAALDEAAAFAPFRAVLVARHGVLVAERYFGNASAEQPRRVNSATKSVVSMLVGHALAQGRLASLDQTVAQLLPEHTARFPDSPAGLVTLRQILTGTTGLAYDFARDMRALDGAADPVQYVFSLPRSGAPAGSWSYNDAAISLLAPILERAYGLKLTEVARQALFAPLGIDTFSWVTDRSGQAMSYAGLQLRPRDFLLLATMVAEGGRGVVPADWLAASLQPHARGAWSLPQVAGGNYGYLWFNGTVQGRPVAWAWGYGGQLAVVAPPLGLAVVTLAQEPPLGELLAQNRAIGEVVARIVAAAA